MRGLPRRPQAVVKDSLLFKARPVMGNGDTQKWDPPAFREPSLANTNHTCEDTHVVHTHMCAQAWAGKGRMEEGQGREGSQSPPLKLRAPPSSIGFAVISVPWFFRGSRVWALCMAQEFFWHL